MIPPDVIARVIGSYIADRDTEKALDLLAGEIMVPAHYEHWLQEYPELFTAFQAHIVTHGKLLGD
jgi:hypothetical protein